MYIGIVIVLVLVLGFSSVRVSRRIMYGCSHGSADIASRAGRDASDDASRAGR